MTTDHPPESPSSLARRLLAGEMDEAVEAAAKAISYPQTWVAMSLADQRLAEDKARAALEAAAPSLLTALLGELEEKRAEVAGLTHLLDHATDEAAEVDRLLDVLDEIARHDCCSEVTEVIRSALASLPTTTKTRSHDEGVQEC